MSTELTIPEPQALVDWGDRKLDNAIQRGHATAGAHMRNFEEAATLTGVLLRERKGRLAHGEWTPWLGENFDGTPATARTYIRMATEWANQNENLLSVSGPPEEPDSEDAGALDGEIVEGEVVDDDPYSAAEAEATHAISNMAEESDPESTRGRLVLVFDRATELEQLLEAGGSVEPRSEKDRQLLLSDIEQTRKTLSRVKKRLQA